MKFGFDKGPHLRDKDHTSQIMRRLFIALLPIIVFTIYKNGILPYNNGYVDLYGAFRPFFMIMTGILTSVFTEIVFIKFILKKDNVVKELKESFAIFPGLFLVLTLPVNTPIWVIAIGSFVATFIGKMLFGGFGYNVFNPALVGSLFVTFSYGALIVARGGYPNAMELDTIAGATPLSSLAAANHLGTWAQIGAPFGSMWNYFLGFIPGSLGETSKILIILAFIYLAFTKVIKWIIPVTYVGVVFIMTYIIGSTNDMGLWYPVFQILSGGLFFGAVFMATDPVTSPTTKVGQLIYGLGLGLLTVIFRFLTPYPEGVLTAILTMNMLVFIIDRVGAKAKFQGGYRHIPTAILLLFILGMSFYIGNVIKPSAKPVDDRFHINEVKTADNQTIYDVTQKGFHGPIRATVTIENGKITTINVTEQEETYWDEIMKSDYITKLINGQNKLENVDAYSGATISSNALKSMVRNVLNDYEAHK